jgi:hypothetical protein
MSTTKSTYTTVPDSKEFEETTFATKQAAIRYGEKCAVPFKVRTSAGNVVYDSIEPADDEDVVGVPDKPVKATKASKAKKDASKDAGAFTVRYREVGPKHFWKALGVTAAEAIGGTVTSNKEMTVAVALPTDAKRLVDVWGDAMEALKVFKKTSTSYKKADKKFDWGRADAYRLEQEFLSTFVKKALKS